MQGKKKLVVSPIQIVPVGEASRSADWNRDYHQKYYREHRASEFLTTSEMRKCHENPTLIREIRGENHVACLECGLLVDKLPQHLSAEHQMSGSEFKHKWGLPKSFPLCSKTFSEKMKTKRGMQLALAGVATRFVKTDSDQHPPLSLPKTDVRKKAWQPRAQKASDWQIAEHRLRGEAQKKIASALELTQGAISARLRRMGFPRSYKGTGLVFYHGEPLTRQHLPLLVQDWIEVKFDVNNGPVQELGDQLKPHEQFTVEEAANQLGAPVSWVREQTRRRARLRLGARRGKRVYLGNAQIRYLNKEIGRIRREGHRGLANIEVTKALHVNKHWITHRLRAKDASAPLSKEIGGRILLLWDALKSEWRTQSASPRGGRPRKLLPSEEVALPGRYRDLLVDLKALLKWLKSQETRVSITNVMDWLCTQAKRGRMRTLLLWPEFFVWVKAGFDPESGRGMDWQTFLLQAPKLSEGNWRPNELALDFLAYDYGLMPTTLRDLLTKLSVAA